MNKTIYCKICKQDSIISLPEEVFACITPKALAELMCNDCTNEALSRDFEYNYPNYEYNVT